MACGGYIFHYLVLRRGVTCTRPHAVRCLDSAFLTLDNWPGDSDESQLCTAIDAICHCSMRIQSINTLVVSKEWQLLKVTIILESRLHVCLFGCALD